MKIKLLAICGTPVKGEMTNTEYMLNEILKSSEQRAAELGDEIETDLVLLGEKKIDGGCDHCNWCLKYQTADVYCSKNDDMEEIYPKIIECDGLILGTPVYIGGMTWLLTAFVHRLRALWEGRYYGFRGPYDTVLKDKVFAASSVAWARHGGVETAMLHALLAGIGYTMIPVQGGVYGFFGAGGVSAAPLGQLVAVSKDKFGMLAAHELGNCVVDRCRLVKAGKAALKYFPAYLE